MTAEPFNLRSAVQHVAETSGLRTPAEIAAKVAESLTRDQLRQALALTLPGYVRIIVTARSSNLRPAPARNPVTKATRTHSWADTLRATRLHVGDDWAVLGDCHADDLRTVADRREEQAAELVAEAARWRALADLMDDLGVATVGELSDEDLTTWARS